MRIFLEEFAMRLGIVTAIVIILLAGQAYAGDDPVLKSQKDKLSYSLGINIGMGLKNQAVDVDSDILTKGIKDALSGANPMIEQTEIGQILADFQKEMMARQQEMIKQLGEKNKIEGEAFLAENKKKEGVKTLPSGLEYKVIKPGTGNKPKLTDVVKVDYRGTLINGTQFDSTYDRGKPATLLVNDVIPGWTEALQLMKEGAKWQIFIPPNLAYGERGAGTQIEPNATLIFDVELISVLAMK
jgi:FKBP-type peptidyl-prolyl cis-trans isomerase FklB